MSKKLKKYQQKTHFPIVFNREKCDFQGPFKRPNSIYLISYPDSTYMESISIVFADLYDVYQIKIKLFSIPSDTF